MDLYLIAHIALTVGLLAGIAAALLVWVDELRDDRARERRIREREASQALAVTNREISRRTEVRHPSPLPTMESRS